MGRDQLSGGVSVPCRDTNTFGKYSMDAFRKSVKKVIFRKKDYFGDTVIRVCSVRDIQKGRISYFL